MFIAEVGLYGRLTWRRYTCSLKYSLTEYRGGVSKIWVPIKFRTNTIAYLAVVLLKISQQKNNI